MSDNYVWRDIDDPPRMRITHNLSFWRGPSKPLIRGPEVVIEGMFICPRGMSLGHRLLASWFLITDRGDPV